MADTGFVRAEEALHAQAMQSTGLDDFGDPAYREGLRVVLDAYDCEARFHPQGRENARANLVQQLETRLRSQRLLREHAGAGSAIARPIVILGLVRTGSTALHHLVGQDPEVQVLEYWLAAHPQTRPPRATWEERAEFQESAAEIAAMYDADPSLRAIHLMLADGPEECRHLLAQSFTDDSFEVNATVPSYTRWYEQGHHVASYRRHRALVSLVGARDPRRWVLKYPVHMKHLGALLEVYPDACVVWTHRDPTRVLSSYVNLIAGFRALFERDIDRTAIAREQLEVWAAAAERAMALRRGRDPQQFVDVHFPDFEADPIAVVRRVYERFGLTLSPASEQRLRAWQEQNRSERHGQHRYATDDFGVTRAEMLDRFAPYMREFALAPEP